MTAKTEAPSGTTLTVIGQDFDVRIDLSADLAQALSSRPRLRGRIDAVVEVMLAELQQIASDLLDDTDSEALEVVRLWPEATCPKCHDDPRRRELVEDSGKAWRSCAECGECELADVEPRS